MSYIVPGDVDSPRGRWRLHLVLYDGGEGNWSAAEGQWENNGRWDAVLAIRWNGKDGDKLGNPQSRGRPTWFIVPKELEPAIRVVINELGTHPDGEVRIEHAGEVDDDTLFDEWVARRGHLQRCRICDAEQERAKAGMEVMWRYHLDRETDHAVLCCQRCKRESLLPVDWRAEAK